MSIVIELKADEFRLNVRDSSAPPALCVTLLDVWVVRVCEYLNVVPYLELRCLLRFVVVLEAPDLRSVDCDLSFSPIICYRVYDSYKDLIGDET